MFFLDFLVNKNEYQLQVSIKRLDYKQKQISGKKLKKISINHKLRCLVAFSVAVQTD